MDHDIASMDLSALRTQRPLARRRRRIKLLPILVALVLVGGGGGVAAFYLWPLIVPPLEVELAAVVAREDVAARRSSSALVATGWAEPDPFAVMIAPQIPGVVNAMPIVEGTQLVAGETIVAQLDTTLIDHEVALASAMLERERAAFARIDVEIEQAQALADRNLSARLSLHELRFKRDTLRANQRRERAELALAEASLGQKGELRVALSQRTRELAAEREQLSALEESIATLSAELVWYGEDARSKRKLADSESINELDAIQAETALAAAQAKLAALQTRAESQREVVSAFASALNLAQELVDQPATLQAMRDAARERVAALDEEIAALDPLIQIAQEEADDALTLNTRVATLHAESSEAQARINSAQAELDLLEARLQLHTVYSPISGEVLAVQARLGGMVAPQADATFICTAFDPMKLAVRVDLPLSDVPAVSIGQEVEVSSDAVSGRSYQGVVTRFVRQANLARNSLQVKVEITDPDNRLRPDMLTRCRFLPVKREREEPSESGEVSITRFFVPSSALQDAGEGQGIYIFDPRGFGGGEGRARLVQVTSTDADDAPKGMIEVEGELSPGVRVLVNPPAGMSDGDRIAPRKTHTQTQRKEQP